MQFIASIHHKGNIVARASVMDTDEARPDEIAGEGMRQLKRDGERNSMTLERPKTEAEKALTAQFVSAVNAFGAFIVDAMDERASRTMTGVVPTGPGARVPLRTGQWSFPDNESMTIHLDALSDEAVDARDRKIDELFGRGKAA